MKGIAAQWIAHKVDAINPMESNLRAKLCLSVFNIILIANRLQHTTIVLNCQLQKI